MTAIKRGPRLWKPVAVAAAAAFFTASLGGAATRLDAWYYELAQPAWKPPDWLFGPAWTLIFALLALSASYAWRDTPRGRERERIIVLYCANAILNVGWSVLFFTFRRPDWALLEVMLLWLSIVLLMKTNARRSRIAAALLAPYLVWVSFAAALNLAVVRLNSPFGD